MGRLRGELPLFPWPRLGGPQGALLDIFGPSTRMAHAVLHILNLADDEESVSAAWKLPKDYVVEVWQDTQDDCCLPPRNTEL